MSPPSAAPPGVPASDPSPGRVATLEALPALGRAWSEAGRRVVMTNGCFDLLHAGHVRSLQAARALGDVLVVALNDDASVARLKGEGRPLQTVDDRAAVLAALRAVDLVVPFPGDTAEAVVRALRPGVYVKGGDYGPGHWPPEASVAEALGARVVFLPLLPDRSTSGLVARLRGPGR